MKKLLITLMLITGVANATPNIVEHKNGYKVTSTNYSIEVSSKGLIKKVVIEGKQHLIYKNKSIHSFKKHKQLNNAHKRRRMHAISKATPVKNKYYKDIANDLIFIKEKYFPTKE